MGRSRRKYKQSRTKVRVGLPRKKPGVFKPAFVIPEALAAAAAASAADGGEEGKKEWDVKGSVIRNYRTFGVVSNPNILGVRARTPQVVQISSLQVPDPEFTPASEFDPIDSGSDLESDDVKSVLGKKRKDGRAAPLQPLTSMQRVHVGKLIEKYGDDYQAMFMDTTLNSMQHSVATLKKLCQSTLDLKEQVKDILMVGKEVNLVEWCHVKRDKNQVAHLLARQGFNGNQIQAEYAGKWNVEEYHPSEGMRRYILISKDVMTKRNGKLNEEGSRTEDVTGSESDIVAEMIQLELRKPMFDLIMTRILFHLQFMYNKA
ncbi:hypothetical protein Cni_G04822 [Canna indica]|uniref:Nucleolar protein 16 n=1 Tax=Canna indica TaxID=4628 RepID=A0AAQ3Q4C2_9LILI|nr:hypothetical protein Cni_G04822 [Canna indica]